MISCARGVSGRSAHRRTLVESVVFCRAPALRGNLRLLMAALGRLKWRCFLLRFCNQMVPVALASMGDMCSELYGRILEKFHPCARPCAVLVQCLERLVHLDFASGAHCGKQISGTIKPRQPPVHMLWGKGLWKNDAVAWWLPHVVRGLPSVLPRFPWKQGTEKHNEFQYLSSRRSKYYKLLRWLPGCKTQEFLSNLMAQSQLSMLTPDRSPRSDYDIKIHAK